MNKNRERSVAILFTSADPAIRYGNITIPHVARQAEPLLNPNIRDSVMVFFIQIYGSPGETPRGKWPTNVICGKRTKHGDKLLKRGMNGYTF